MHETLRMLGEQHEADLEREARYRHLAAAIRGSRLSTGPVVRTKIARRKWIVFVRSRLPSLLR